MRLSDYGFFYEVYQGSQHYTKVDKMVPFTKAWAPYVDGTVRISIWSGQSRFAHIWETPTQIVYAVAGMYGDGCIDKDSKQYRTNGEFTCVIQHILTRIQYSTAETITDQYRSMHLAFTSFAKRKLNIEVVRGNEP